jgi:hypothetical protein
MSKGKVFDDSKGCWNCKNIIIAHGKIPGGCKVNSKHPIDITNGKCKNFKKEQ